MKRIHCYRHFSRALCEFKGINREERLALIKQNKLTRGLQVSISNMKVSMQYKNRMCPRMKYSCQCILHMLGHANDDKEDVTILICIRHINSLLCVRQRHAEVGLVYCSQQVIKSDKMCGEYQP